jgi:tellurite resistance protein TerC
MLPKRGMMALTSMLASPWLGMPVGIWLGFVTLVALLVALDLGVFQRLSHEIGIRESFALSGFFVALGLGFSAVVWCIYYRHDPALIIDPTLLEQGSAAGRAWSAAELFLTGLVIEQSLSLDNIFVISLIFGFFAVPRTYQHEVLFWGILGVIILRGIMILTGATLLAEAHWVLYVFAAFLVVTGLRMLVSSDDDIDVGASPLTRWVRRLLRVSDKLHGGRFVVVAPHPTTGKPVVWATRLLLCLVTIEFVDIIFAVDSVPAVFSLTQEPFIVYTSNIFAILGLRSLYFMLSAVVHRFQMLNYALAVVLVFIGGEIFLRPWTENVPAWVSLFVTIAILASGVLFSLWQTRTRNSVEQSVVENAERHPL